MSEETARKALDDESRIISLYEAADILGASYRTAMGLYLFRTSAGRVAIFAWSAGVPGSYTSAYRSDSMPTGKEMQRKWSFSHLRGEGRRGRGHDYTDGVNSENP